MRWVCPVVFWWGSLGGRVALDVALARPDLVVGVVHISGGLGFTTEVQAKVLPSTTRRVQSVLESSSLMQGAIDAWLSSRLFHPGPGTDPALLERRLRRMAAEYSWAHFRERGANMRDPEAPAAQ